MSSAIPSNVRSPSPTPSQCSASSLFSSTTVLQGQESSQNGSHLDVLVIIVGVGIMVLSHLNSFFDSFDTCF